MRQLNILSLFSGVGGFDLGFERAGFKVICQVEADPKRRHWLREHFPGIPVFDDVRTFGPEVCWELYPHPDVVIGGFPCQPVSYAGRRKGEKDERWLWPEFARIVRSIRPRYVVIENPPGITSLGLNTVLCDLADVGYDAEWQPLSAAAFGAPHLRDRILVVAYPGQNGLQARSLRGVLRARRSSPQSEGTAQAEDDGGPREMAHTHEKRCTRPRMASTPLSQVPHGGRAREDVPDSHMPGRSQQRLVFSEEAAHAAFEHCRGWATEPKMGRVVHGLPGRVAQIEALGDAIVPQVAEFVARLLLTHYAQSQN